MNPIATLLKHGLYGTAQLYWSELRYRCARFRTRSVEEYKNPSQEELLRIETDLFASGVAGSEWAIDSAEYRAFTKDFPFPSDYHGGMQTGVWHEKIFEHYISFTLLDINSYGPNDTYVDVAAGGSPWVRILRERRLNAFAIDLAIRPSVRGLHYYREEDATRSSFASGSVRGISLHCAYEMFIGDSDMRAIEEFARILAPGGAAVIVPLYLNTHFCCFSSPDCWGKGFGDPGAREYVYREFRAIPSARNYDAAKLKERVLERARIAGLVPHLYYLRSQRDISPEIYCHFVLELRKPNEEYLNYNNLRGSFSNF